MNAIDLLEEQHEEIDALIADLEKGRSLELKRERFAEMADKLAAHLTIEEKLFYPAVLARKTEDILLESLEEHLSIKRLLADLLALEVSDDQFGAKLSVLKEQIEHHAHEEEEKDLFPKVKKAFGKDELEALGGEMTLMFVTMLEKQPRKHVPAEIKEAASLPAAVR